MDTNIVLVGKSASGKSTLANFLTENFRYDKVIACTTRPKRDSEIDGKDYYFLTREEFDKKEENGEFVETAEYRGWKYGTLKSELEKDGDKVFVVNPNGLVALKGIGIPMISFYIYVRSGIRVLRQIRRGDEIDEVERRFWTDEKDFRGIQDEVDFVVNNDTDLEGCIDEILFDVLYKYDPQNVEEFIDKLQNTLERINKHFD